MLDKLSKKILKHMQTASSHPSDTYYDFDDDLDTIATSVSSDSESVRAAVRFLNDQGYIKYGYTQSGHLYCFYLDHKGLHQKELDWIAWKSFLMKSILTPIVVAFLTTLFVNNLWPRIWHWLTGTLAGT